jgi:hypothetical protein
MEGAKMKRVLLVLVAVLAGLAAECQTKTIVGSTITVTWDAPALGTIPPAEIAYEVFSQPRPSGTVVLVGTVSIVEQVITFTVEGPYRIGVRTKRTAPDATVLYSDYFWSDVDGTTPWYAVYYASPAKVQRVRIK